LVAHLRYRPPKYQPRQLTMPQLVKRPIVIQDLIDISTYISHGNLDAGDRFIYVAKPTFQLIAKSPGIGRFSGFTNPEVAQVRQYTVKGFPNYLILYELTEDTIDIIRVLHGARNLENTLSRTDQPK
jgi:toxin ParE1/3/4